MTDISKLKEALNKLNKLDSKNDIKVKHDVYKRLGKPAKENNFILTKNLFWKLFKKHSKGNYIINQHNQKVIYTIFRYFLKIENFNQFELIKSEPSLQKGILLYGDYGIGKSYLFEILHLIGKELVTMRNCFDLWFNCISSGSFVDQYMEAAKNESSNFNIKFFYKGKLYIDDLGFEKKAFNKTELLGEVLFERYRNRALTFVTTNLKPSEITERYGERIGDRLPEMFNIIKWEGESFRK